MNQSYICKGFLLLLMLHSTIQWSQNITGKIVDNNNNPLEYAAIAIINPKDSTLISFGSSSKNGEYKLTEISKGKKIFQVHLVGFKTYQTSIDFQNKSIHMEDIVLKNSTELEEVVINAMIPISIKKDTISYNAKAFKINMDDTVEDLLKKLPGIEVDVSGKITAQGEEVKIVYVDGKEFFSGDPTIASKNLSADAIKRIEIIDEKSEKARVTGLNDDEQQKVINLELKEANKVKGFGKINGGYGSDNRFVSSLNYNKIRSKTQISMIGNYNNVNSSGSDISEIMTYSGMGDIGSQGSNPGYLTTGIGGLNLGYEFKKNQNFNTDYFYNYTKATSGDIRTVRTEFIGDEKILSENKNSNENSSNNHSSNFSYRDRSNELSNLYFRGSIKISNHNANALNILDKYNGANELDLQSLSNSNTKNNNGFGNLSVHYVKRFSTKNKRNFSIAANVNSAKNESVSTNNELNKFNIADSINAYESNQEIKRIQDTKNFNAGFSLNYTEPLSSHHYLEFRGKINYKTSEDNVDQSKYINGIIQEPFIYHSYYRNTDKKGGLYYRFNSGKFNFFTGIMTISQTLDFGLKNQEEYTNKYENFNPEISFTYRPKRGRMLRFNAIKSNNIPNSIQILPVVNDFNPLYIKRGNPNLTPDNNYSFSGSYVNHNFTTGLNFYSQISYKYTTNTIVNSEFTNDLGIRTTTYVNAGDKDDLYLNFNLGKRVKSLGLRFNINVTGDYSKYLSVINNVTNETISKNGGLGITLESNNKETIDAIIGASLNKNYTLFTAATNTDREYLQNTYFTKINWNITKRLNLKTQFKYNLYKDTNYYTDQSIPVWNASVSYTCFKSKSMNIMLSALDILNKNRGIERSSADNYFEESQMEVLSNYFMFSLTYNLNNK